MHWKYFKRCTFSILLAAGLGAVSSLASAQSALENEAEKELSTILAASLILTDTDAVSFGVLSFDPDRFLPGIDEGFGNEETLSRRRGVKVFNVPWRWGLSPKNKRTKHTLKTRFSYLELKQSVNFGSEQNLDPEDEQKKRVFDLYGGYKVAFDWTEHWRVSAETGIHAQRYDDDYQYNSAFSQTLQGDVDGLLFNNSAQALVAALKGDVAYEGTVYGKAWQWQAMYSYYSGETVSTSDNLPDAFPEAWSLENELSLKWPLPQLWQRDNRLKLAASRVDIGADAERAFATHCYYKFSVGWLIKTPDHLSWFDNLGLAATVNVGSALSGGALQLLYNEEF